MLATCPEIWAIRNRAADLVGSLAPGEHAADIGERAVDDEPDLLDADPERFADIDARGHGLAGLRSRG